MIKEISDKLFGMNNNNSVGRKTDGLNESLTQKMFDKNNQDSNKKNDCQSLISSELSGVAMSISKTQDSSQIIEFTNKRHDEIYSDSQIEAFEDLQKVINIIEDVISEDELIQIIGGCLDEMDKQNRVNWISRGCLGSTYVRGIKRSKGGRGNTAPNGYGARLDKLAEQLDCDSKNLRTEVNMYNTLIDNRLDYANDSLETIRSMRTLLLKEIFLFSKVQSETAVFKTDNPLAAIELGILAQQKLGKNEKYTHAMFLINIKDLLTKKVGRLAKQNSSANNSTGNTITLKLKSLPKKVRDGFDSFVKIREVDKESGLKILLKEYFNLVAPLLQKEVD